MLGIGGQAIPGTSDSGIISGLVGIGWGVNAVGVKICHVALAGG